MKMNFIFNYTRDLKLQVIAEELAKRGQPASIIEKVLGANFLRVIGEIWGTN
jgi:microsomal dipeptidase-like Zn-dependent dipeptidase